MSYIRPMGDGPITDPSQVDDSIIVGTVPPTRVDCARLPADSPFRTSGQVCAGAPRPGNDIWDAIQDALSPASSSPTSAPEEMVAGNPNLWLLVGAGVGAYYLFRKKKR